LDCRAKSLVVAQRLPRLQIGLAKRDEGSVPHGRVDRVPCALVLDEQPRQHSMEVCVVESVGIVVRDGWHWALARCLGAVDVSPCGCAAARKMSSGLLAR